MRIGNHNFEVLPFTHTQNLCARNPSQQNIATFCSALREHIQEGGVNSNSLEIIAAVTAADAQGRVRSDSTGTNTTHVKLRTIEQSIEGSTNAPEIGQRYTHPQLRATLDVWLNGTTRGSTWNPEGHAISNEDAIQICGSEVQPRPSDRNAEIAAAVRRSGLASGSHRWTLHDDIHPGGQVLVAVDQGTTVMVDGRPW